MTTKLFTLLCENERGLLSRLLQTFERAGYLPATVAQYQTDIRGTVLIMLEVAVPAEQVDTYLRRCGKIIGVLDAVVSFGDCKRASYFRFDRVMLDQRLLDGLIGEGATILGINDHLLVGKTGTLSEIERFYRKFESVGLLGACHLPMPVGENGLIGNSVRQDI